MHRHEELRPLSRGHQPILMHARDLRWRATYLERGDAHLQVEALGRFRAYAEQELGAHLAAEETHLLPRLAAHTHVALTAALEGDASARERVRRAAVLALQAESVERLREISDALEEHARGCERTLFPLAERVLGERGLAGLATDIGAYQI